MIAPASCNFISEGSKQKVAVLCKQTARRRWHRPLLPAARSRRCSCPGKWSVRAPAWRPHFGREENMANPDHSNPRVIKPAARRGTRRVPHMERMVMGEHIAALLLHPVGFCAALRSRGGLRWHLGSGTSLQPVGGCTPALAVRAGLRTVPPVPGGSFPS